MTTATPTYIYKCLVVMVKGTLTWLFVVCATSWCGYPFVCLYQQVIVQSLRGWGTISIMSYSNKCPALCEWLCSNVRNCQLRAVSGMPVCGLVSAILFFVYCHHPSQCDYLSKIKFKRLTTFPDAGIWQQNDGAELRHCPWSKHTAQGIKG